jgi:AcrR family transcriptional regulator
MNISTESRDYQTRCRIVETAEQLFKQIGFQKTTVADIAKKLGMSSANVYRFFDSKKAINESVALRLTSEVEEACRKIAAERTSPSDRLQKILQTIHTMNSARYVQDVRMHEMVTAAMRESWHVVGQHIANVDQIVSDVLQQGVASGEFAPCDLEITARCICTSMMRFSHPGAMIECQNMPLPTVEQMTQFVLKALKP